MEREEREQEDEDKGLRNLVLVRKRERRGAESAVAVVFVRDRGEQRGIECLSSAVPILSLRALGLKYQCVEDISRIRTGFRV